MLAALPVQISTFKGGLPLHYKTQRGLHDSHVDFLMHQFKERTKKADGFLMPSFLVVWQEMGEIGFIPMPWDSEVTKYACLDALFAFLQEKPCERYSMYSETWIASRSKEQVENGPYVKPSDDPASLDGLMCLTVERNVKEVIMSSWIMENASTKDACLKEHESAQAIGFTGVMTQLMGDRDRGGLGGFR
jgi:hypothetical protein